MRTVAITADPDSQTLRSVTLPASWDDNAAQALAELAVDGGPVRLASEAARWIDRIDTTPQLDQTSSKDGPVSIGRSLSYLLLMRHMAPNRALWQGRDDEQFGFVVKLSSFVADNLFSPEQFVACLELACESLRRIHLSQKGERSGDLPLFEEYQQPVSGESTAGIILLSDLDACLAAIGLDYDSEEGRQFSIAVTALASLVLKKNTLRPLTVLASPLFPSIEHIATAIAEACPACKAPFPPVELGFSAPGPIDALLGVEACGLAPIFSPLDEKGHLRASTQSRLAFRGLTPEKALALALNNENPLPIADGFSFARMHDALIKLADYLPPRPEPEMETLLSRLERGVRRSLPPRQNGFSQKTSIGGHALFMRTSEFEDGSLGALNLVPSRESPMARGLMECLGHAVSIGLQCGVPLETFIDQFAYTHFGPCGTVEGDPSVNYASSMLDYAFRVLSETYLGKHMPDAPLRSPEDQTEDPLLPFGQDKELHKKLPKKPHSLRLVS